MPAPPCRPRARTKARIAFKLVWAPPAFETLLLVGDDGEQLASGTPTGRLPALRERQMNYALVQGSKYAAAADAVAAAAGGAANY